MHLIQILLPLQDNEGAPFNPEFYREVREELSARYGGLTAFTRAPAEGHWQDDGKTTRDEIVVFEVMVEELATSWWRDYRRKLERVFRQDVIVIRAQEIQLL
jgi:hypothetical protein